MNSVVCFEKVGLRYRSGNPVLKNVSLELHSGRFYFLTGRSGAGKTSLLRMLYLGILPSAGILKIFDRDVSTIVSSDVHELRKKIGVVFQDFNLIPHLTVLENVALPLKIMGESVESREEQAREILRWVGLEEFFNSYPEFLSGGQKQRVAIARAVVTKPDLLLADEPTGNVDEVIGNKLMNLFYSLHKVGTCVVVATHSRHFIDKFAYSEIRIDRGHVLMGKDES